MQLNFTKYEAQVLNTLIRYIVLSASEIQKYSGVPQPKVYGIIDKLKKKGFVDIIPKGSKNVYMIKPREVVQELLLEYTRKIVKIGQESVDIVNNFYNSEEVEELPFIGIAGQINIQEYLYTLIDTAKESIIVFFPPNHYDDRITSLLNQRSKELDIKLIFHDSEVIESVRDKFFNIELYQLKSPAFDIIKEFMGKIEKFLQPENNTSYGFQILKNIASLIDEIFGLIVIDKKKSFFKVPLPIPLPIALLSSLHDIVEFHNKGIEQILSSSYKI